MRRRWFMFVALAVSAVAVFLSVPTVALADDTAPTVDGWSWND